MPVGGDRRRGRRAERAATDVPSASYNEADSRPWPQPCRTQALHQIKVGDQAEAEGDGRAPATRSGTKQALLVDLLRRKGGATIAEVMKATGWQPHSVRGAISGNLKKKLGLAVVSDKVEGRGRVYRITGKR